MKDFLSYLKDVTSSVFKGDKKSSGDPIKDFEDFLEQEKKKQDLPEKPKVDKGEALDKIEYTPKTDDEIKGEATGKVDNEKNNAISNLEKELEQLKSSYEADKERAGKGKTEKEKEVGEIYDNAQKRTDDDVLKRGLARSSIAALTKSGLESERADKITNISESFATEINAIDKNLAGLSAKREKALNDFDMTYAAKLTEEINKMKTDRQKRMDEVIKYNNDVKEKETQAERDRLKLESSLYSDLLSQKDKEYLLGQNSLQDKAYDKSVYIKARDLLRGLSADEARKLLKDNRVFEASLTDDYYFMLQREFA